MSMTAKQLNAIETEKRDRHLKASMQRVRTEWRGRNPVSGASGHDSKGHKSTGGGVSSF